MFLLDNNIIEVTWQEGLKQILAKSIRKNPFTSVSVYINIGSRTIAPNPKTNPKPNPNPTLYT